MSYYDSEQDLTIVQMVRDALSWQENDVMVVSASGEFTRDQVVQRCEALRDELVHVGLSPQDRVAYVGGSDLDIVVGQFGIVLAGGVPVPLPEHNDADAWAGILDTTGASFAVCEVGHEAKLAQACGACGASLRVIGLVPDGSLVCPSGATVREDHASAMDDLAEVVLSSGSTGTPKAFAYSQEVEYYFVSTWLQIYGKREAGRYLCIGPASAMHPTLSCLLRREVLVIYSDPMTPCDLACALERERITDLFVPPFMLEGLADEYESGSRDLSALQRIAYAGQMVPALEKKALAARLDCEIVQFYGNTESGLLAILGPEDHRSGDVRILESAGIPFSKLGTRIQIWDFETGKPLEAGCIGKVMVRGHGITRRIMGVDADFMVIHGWRDTEDAGYLDESGRLFVRGRACDAFRGRDGVLFIADVEARLLTSDDLADAAVLAVRDEAGEKHVFVWAQPSNEALSSSLLSASLISEFGIAESLLHVSLLDRIPRHNRTPFKVDRAQLKAKAFEVLAGRSDSATA